MAGSTLVVARSTVVVSASDSAYGGSDLDPAVQPNNKTGRQVIATQWLAPMPNIKGVSRSRRDLRIQVLPVSAPGHNCPKLKARPCGVVEGARQSTQARAPCHWLRSRFGREMSICRWESSRRRECLTRAARAHCACDS